MKNIFTKELGGTLLIVMPDGRTFEMSRGKNSNDINISADDGAECSEEERKLFYELWKNSSCRKV